MKFSVGKIDDRVGRITEQLNLYLSKKILNPEQREDFRDLQEELSSLQRTRAVLLTEPQAHR